MLTFLLMACRGPTEEGSLVIEAAVVEAIPTVVDLTWEGGPATVSYGLAGELDRTTTGDGHAQLIGLKSSTPYLFEVTLDDGSDTGGGGFETGALPIALPSASVVEYADGFLEEGFFVTTSLSSISAAIVLDHEGDIVWWSLDDRSDIQIARAELMLDGSGVVYGVSTNDPSAEDRHEELVEMSWDHSVETVIDAPKYHHDFVQVDDGFYAYQALTSMQTEAGTTMGDLIMTVDREGATEEIWNGFDDFPFDADYADREREKYWHHANAMDVDRETGELTISMRNLNTITRLDMDTGEILWSLGEFGDFEITGEREHTFQQHQFELIDGGIVMFDNGTSEMLDSRIVEYVLDYDEMTADEVWTYRTDPPLFNYALGAVDRLDDGNTLVTWSTGGQIEQVAPDGTLLWRLNADIGAAYGYTQHVVSLEAE
ncbi:MAG: hypothetical protein GY913_17115 [Proteobacteria bacterium]|nr:hypothetical protein [Pseudomonadota bacterium]MCP4918626.1 hypothetical protein [Pseudomonadota bacterium]